MEKFVENMQANKNLFLKLMQESQRLRPESQRQIQVKRYTFHDLIRALIDEGIREGVFRDVNSLLAARVLLGAISAMLFESRSTGRQQETLNELLDIFFRGIAII